MNRLITLIKITLKSSQLNNNPNNKKVNKKKQTFAFILLGLLLVIFVGLPFGAIAYFQGLALRNLEVNIFKLVIPCISIMTPLLSLGFILSNLFLNNNDEVMLSLPITHKEIFISRLFTSILQAYTFLLLFFAPMLFGLLIGLGANFDLYFSIIIYLIIAPIVPVALLSFIFTLLSKLINFKSHKAVLNVLMIAFPIIIGVGMQLIGQQSGEFIENPEQTAEIISSLINSIGNIFSVISFYNIPNIMALSKLNIFVRLGASLLSIVTTFLITYLLVILTSKLYYPYLLKGENSKKNKKKVVDKDYKSSSSFKALMLTDFKEINRSPVLVINFIFPLIIFPIFLVIGFISGFSKSVENSNEGLNQIIQFMDLNNPIIICIVIAIIVFISSMSFASITAISRTGKNSFVLKMIPVKPIKIILSKIMFGFLSSLLVALFLIIVLTAINIFSILDSILILLTIIPIIMLLNLISISLDLWHPYLTWSTENELVKNSTKAAIYMLVCWVGSAILFGIGVLFTWLLPTSGYILLALIMLLSILVCFLMYKHLNKSTIFNKI